MVQKIVVTHTISAKQKIITMKKLMLMMLALTIGFGSIAQTHPDSTKKKMEKEKMMKKDKKDWKKKDSMKRDSMKMDSTKKTMPPR